MPWSRPWRSSYRTPSVVSLGVCTNIVRHAYNHIRAIETSSILSCCSDILAKWTGLPIVFIVPNTLASLYQYPYPAWFFPPNEIWCVLLRIWWKPSFNFFEQCVHVCTYMKTDIILSNIKAGTNRLWQRRDKHLKHQSMGQLCPTLISQTLSPLWELWLTCHAASFCDHVQWLKLNSPQPQWCLSDQEF